MLSKRAKEIINETANAAPFYVRAYKPFLSAYLVLSLARKVADLERKLAEERFSSRTTPPTEAKP